MTNNNSQKGFVMPAMIAIVAVALVLNGVVYYGNLSQKQEDKMVQEKAMMEKKAMEQKEEEAVMNKKDEETMKEDEGSMMDKKDGMMSAEGGSASGGKYSSTVLAGTSAPLLDFTKADYDAAVKTDKLVVLYFYANWCPICIAEFPVMQKVFNELTTDKVIGFRVNYNDDQTDNDEKNLAKQFVVVYQHTKVFVKNGQRILKSPEGWDYKRYDTEISKALDQ